MVPFKSLVRFSVRIP